MKKQVLIAIAFLMITKLAMATASFKQGNWRWKNNDGDVNTATWRAAENVSIDISGADVLRLRIETGTSAVGPDGYVGDKLSVIVSSDNWVTSTPLTLGDNGSPFKIATVNAFINGGVTPSTPIPITNRQLTGNAEFSSYTYLDGSLMLGNITANYGASETISYIQEYEIIILPTATLESGKTYEFKLTGATFFPPITPLPSVKTPAILPITLEYLTAKLSVKGIDVSWKTSSETKNKKFDLQRSNDGINWDIITSVDAKQTTSGSTYSFIDKSPLIGVNYYRLAQHDIDGKVNYTGVTSANFDLKSNELVIYPNPIINQFNVSLSGHENKIFKIALFDLNGQLADEKQVIANNSGLTFNLNKALKPGIYITRITGNGLNETQQIIIK